MQRKLRFQKEPLEENSIFKAITRIYQMAFRSFEENFDRKVSSFPLEWHSSPRFYLDFN